MINYTYQLTGPQVFSVEYNDLSLGDNLIIKPVTLSICQADMRYYFGLRDRATMEKKLPMALIHECCAKVVYDPQNIFSPDDIVVPVPNIPTHEFNSSFYENYGENPKFLSSGLDGFMREYIDIPYDRVVKAQNTKNTNVLAMTELVSVCVHAVNRFINQSHPRKETIGIWGDGSVAYCLACVVKAMLPESKLVIIGRTTPKLNMFTFADYVFEDCNVPDDIRVDHAFECCGGEGSADAIDNIISRIYPQGTIMLLGVSENKVGILTRMVLEKGLTLIGSSRSGICDFEKAVEIIGVKENENRLSLISNNAGKVKTVEDMNTVFNKARTGMFKTVFDWGV